MIRFILALTKKPEPKECRPNGNAGWYVIDRATTIAFTDTEEEADRVIGAFEAAARAFEAAARAESLASDVEKAPKVDPRCVPSLAGGLNPYGTTDNGHLPDCECEDKSPVRVCAKMWTEHMASTTEEARYDCKACGKRVQSSSQPVYCTACPGSFCNYLQDPRTTEVKS